MTNQLIEDLKWRYAVKKYDDTKKIPTEIFNAIKEVLRLTPSSNGLQPYKFLVVENPEVRERLRAYSYNQSPITDASHLIVFCSYKSLNEHYYDNFIQLNSTVREVPIESLDGFKLHLKRELLTRSNEETLRSNEKQCYIALGQLLQTAATYRVDASPIEGFIPEKYDEILQLDDKNLTATVVCTLGYRAEDDPAQKRTKVRKASEDLFEVI